jgi:hypothetical protein
MTIQFLPWARRGLAGELGHIDDGTALPARATFPVSVTVNGQSSNVDIDTYGPGDVTGLDITTISRTSPRRYATNVAPDEFAAIEFGDPDLPWMFTPATAGPDHHLRPWLVLVVVTQTEGVAVAVDRTRPLPTLTIEAPAVPAEELPDLSQSWAWAHAQVVTAQATDRAVDALDGAPGQCLSRLLCPRRLRPDTSYIAALVPAFNLGVDAGMGRPNSTTDTGPAWDLAALGDTVSLPVYYHWEFTTGPAGDFESLARLLTPMFVPDGVGQSPMFIGEAHPALPPLSPSNGGIVSMEGALRAPGSRSGSELDERHAAWVDALTAVVDATADAASSGTASDAEAVAPPIYGEWHVNVHQIPKWKKRPRWLRDLNADPRHRAAAGLGAELIRANQEDYVDAAWTQVGDVLAANRLLDLSRAIAAIADRVHTRHVAGIDPIRAIALVDRAKLRLPFQGRTLGDVIDKSATLAGFNTRNFRRITSPRSAVLRQAERRFGAPLALGASADISGLARIPTGELAAVIDQPPDGLRTTTLADIAKNVVRDGGVTIDTALVNSLTATLTKCVNQLAGVTLPPMQLHPDLGSIGVLTDAHLNRLRDVSGLADDVVGHVGELRAAIADQRGAPGTFIGVLAGPNGLAPVVVDANGRVGAGAGSTVVDITSPVVTAPAVMMRPRVVTVPNTIGARVDTATVTPRPATTGIGPAPPAPVAISAINALAPEVTRAGLDQALIAGTLDLGDLGKTIGLAATGPPGTHRGTVVTFIPPSDAGRSTLERFIDGFIAHDQFVAELDRAIPTVAVPKPLDLNAARDAIVETTRPRPMIEARLATRIRAAGHEYTFGTVGALSGRIRVVQADPIEPIMVGPVLDRPLYLDLAAFDQDRFLPGAGATPDNAITLLETNPRFVESFMVGVNHEFNRELLWRRYPTDRRGTAFRRFWDRIDDSDDIEPIHMWRGPNRLGSNSFGDADGSIVLLVRGQLLRRYPNTLIYAAPATASRRIDPSVAPIAPVFAGFLEPDLAFVGFDLDSDAAAAGNGTMFVLQEQPAEPRFGLDVPSGTPSAAATVAPSSWSDLTWDHVATAPGEFLDVSVFSGNPQRPLSPTAPAITASFGAGAGHMAAITFQRPFRAAVHSSEILP